MTWLAVFDLDSIVADPEGVVSDADRTAIARARSAGVTIGFASARRAPSAASRLRALGLDGWVIGCDGAHIARARDDRLLSRHTLPSTIAARITEIVGGLGLRPFAITLDGVHGPPEDEGLAREALGPVLDAYTPRWPRLADISALVAVGDPSQAREALTTTAKLAPTRIAPSTYEVAGHGVLRVNPLRSSRARAMFDLAARLGIRKTRVLYAGGVPDGRSQGWRDGSALREVGRVLCPPGVARELATGAEVLESPAGHGAIAEALHRWTTGVPPDDGPC